MSSDAPDKSDHSQPRSSRIQAATHALAIAFLGIIVPTLILSQALFGLSGLRSSVQNVIGQDSPIVVFSQAKSQLATGNDYALFSTLTAERANESVLINKQVMKITIMQIGFSVISVGMMFIVLGINDGGADGKFDISDLKFDFKTGSTGVLVFVIGAAMASAGGILKNEYNTVPIPEYVEAEKVITQPDESTMAAYKKCKSEVPSDYQACFASLFEQTHAVSLK